jgi:hypothetical protein
MGLFDTDSKWQRAQDARDQREAAQIAGQLIAAGYTDTSEAEVVVNLNYYRGLLAGIRWSDWHDTPQRIEWQRIKDQNAQLEKMRDHMVAMEQMQLEALRREQDKLMATDHA